MRRTGPTNRILRLLIHDLRRSSRIHKAPAWRRVAEILARSARRRVAVNLSRIERYARNGDIIVVPGKVLGGGVLKKNVTIAAFSYSSTALKKIVASGSKALTIHELLKDNPTAKRVKIIT